MNPPRSLAPTTIFITPLKNPLPKIIRLNFHKLSKLNTLKDIGIT